MVKFCSFVGVLCVIIGIIASFDNLFSGVSLLTSGFILLVLGQHLYNQAETIKAINEIACPQLFYANHFAPTILHEKIIEDEPEFGNADVSLSAPTITDNGTFRLHGRVKQRKGIKLEYADFFAEIAPGQSYHLRSEWKIVKFEWR